MVGYVKKIRSNSFNIREIGKELHEKTQGHFDFTKKDYSDFVRVPRREQQPTYNAKAAFENSLVPIDEIFKASRGNIIDYCERNRINITKRPDGAWELDRRKGVVLHEYNWVNHRNRTQGTLIDFVAAHKRVSFLQAVAEINGNPRLLLLEKEFGEVKRRFTALHVPKGDQKTVTESIRGRGLPPQEFGNQS